MASQAGLAGTGEEVGPGFSLEYRDITIAGDGVVLRPFVIGDVGRYVDAARDPEIARWSRLAPEWTTPTGARAYIASLPDLCAAGEKLDLAVSLPRSQQLIGHVALRNLEWTARRARLGIWLCGDVRGRGLSVPAVRAMVDWAFGTVALNRIDSDPEVDNRPSICMLEKAGFRLEGRMRAHAFAEGEHRDALLYARLAADPDPACAPS